MNDPATIACTIAWQDGVLIPLDAVTIAPQDRGFLYGDTVFETVSAVAGQALDLPAHRARLDRGLAVLGMTPPRDLDRLETIVADVLAANSRGSDLGGILRITVSRGPGERGLATAGLGPAQMLITWSPPRPPTADRLRTGLRVVTTDLQRCATGSPLAAIKAGNYLTSILAMRQAEAAGAAEALMRDPAGGFASGSYSNLALIEGDRVIVPPLASGCLPGTLRARLLTVAPQSGWRVVERPIALTDLIAADVPVLTNSVMIVQPIGRIDGPDLPAEGRSYAIGPALALRAALVAALVRDHGLETGGWLSPSFDP